jgi:hypothetical protein
MRCKSGLGQKRKSKHPALFVRSSFKSRRLIAILTSQPLETFRGATQTAPFLSHGQYPKGRTITDAGRSGVVALSERRTSHTRVPARLSVRVKAERHSLNSRCPLWAPDFTDRPATSSASIALSLEECEEILRGITASRSIRRISQGLDDRLGSKSRGRWDSAFRCVSFVPFFRAKSSTKRLSNHLGCRIASHRVANDVAKLPAPFRSLYESIA